MIGRHELAVRTLDLETGDVTIASGNRSDTLSFDGRTLRTIHGPRYRLLLIGAGQVSQYLASMAQMLGYQVTVCDPREEYASGFADPGARASTFTREMPDDAVVAMEFDAHTACVALTHDPKLDDLALMEALKSPAFYVGALGSRANNDKRREASRGIRPVGERDRATARAGRAVSRQQDAAGDCGVGAGGDDRSAEWRVDRAVARGENTAGRPERLRFVIGAVRSVI